MSERYIGSDSDCMVLILQLPVWRFLCFSLVSCEFLGEMSFVIDGGERLVLGFGVFLGRYESCFSKGELVPSTTPPFSPPSRRTHHGTDCTHSPIQLRPHRLHLPNSLTPALQASEKKSNIPCSTLLSLINTNYIHPHHHPDRQHLQQPQHPPSSPSTPSHLLLSPCTTSPPRPC